MEWDNGVTWRTRDYNGCLRADPQLGPGAETLLRGEAAKPREAETFVAFGCKRKL